MALKGTTTTTEKQALTYSVSPNTGQGAKIQGQVMGTGDASYFKEDRLDGYAQTDISRVIYVGLGQ